LTRVQGMPYLPNNMHTAFATPSMQCYPNMPYYQPQPYGLTYAGLPLFQRGAYGARPYCHIPQDRLFAGGAGLNIHPGQRQRPQTQPMTTRRPDKYSPPHSGSAAERCLEPLAKNEEQPKGNNSGDAPTMQTDCGNTERNSESEPVVQADPAIIDMSVMSTPTRAVKRAEDMAEAAKQDGGKDRPNTQQCEASWNQITNRDCGSHKNLNPNMSKYILPTPPKQAIQGERCGEGTKHKRTWTIHTVHTEDTNGVQPHDEQRSNNTDSESGMRSPQSKNSERSLQPDPT
jgi:hypothetical protein